MNTSFWFQAASAVCLSSAFLSAGSAFAQCDRPVDPKRIVIYVGMNHSLLEIKAAEESACLRGDTFRRIPDEVPGEGLAYSAILNVKRIEREVDDLNRQMSRMKCEGDEAEGTPCDQIEDRIGTLTRDAVRSQRVFDTYFEKIADQAQVLSVEDRLKEILSEAAARNAAPVALVLSGHSGGSGVWGEIGSLGFSQVREMMKTAYRGKESLLEKLEQVFLWGCNTMNPFSSSEPWINFNPRLRLLLGFQGTAPNALSSASYGLLRSGLRTEAMLDRILRSSNPEAKAKSEFDALSAIRYTIASAYIGDPARNRGWYYERIRHDEERTTWTSEVRPLMTQAQCRTIADEIQRDQTMISRYLTGELTISTNTSGGELRQIYTRARRNEACRQVLGFPHSADKIGLVLFWHHVKKNVGRFVTQKYGNWSSRLGEHLNGSAFDRAVSESNRFQKEQAKNLRERLEKDVREAEDHLAKTTVEFEKFRNEVEKGYSKKELNRQLRRLKRRIAKAERKLARGKDVRSTLEKMKEEFTTLESIRSKLESGQNMTTILSGLAQKQQYAKNEVDNKKNLLVTFSPTVMTYDVDSLRTNLRKLDETARILESSTFENATFQELLTALTFLKGINQKRTDYPFASISGLASLDAEVRKIQMRGMMLWRLLFELNGSCQAFEQWHEYIENPTAQQTPTSNCY